MNKQENAKKAIELVDQAWKAKSAILLTDDYLYLLFQVEPGKWQEASFIFEDGSLEIRQLDPERALMYFIEEVTTGLPNFDSYIVVTDNESKAKVTERLHAIAEG